MDIPSHDLDEIKQLLRDLPARLALSMVPALQGTGARERMANGRFAPVGQGQPGQQPTKMVPGNPLLRFLSAFLGAPGLMPARVREEQPPVAPKPPPLPPFAQPLPVATPFAGPPTFASVGVPAQTAPGQGSYVTPSALGAAPAPVRPPPLPVQPPPLPVLTGKPVARTEPVPAPAKPATIAPAAPTVQPLPVAKPVAPPQPVKPSSDPYSPGFPAYMKLRGLPYPIPPISLQGKVLPGYDQQGAEKQKKPFHWDEERGREMTPAEVAARPAPVAPQFAKPAMPVAPAPMPVQPLPRSAGDKAKPSFAAFLGRPREERTTPAKVEGILGRESRGPSPMPVSSSPMPPAPMPAQLGAPSPSAIAPMAQGAVGGVGAMETGDFADVVDKFADAVEVFEDVAKELKRDRQEGGPQKGGGFVPTLEPAQEKTVLAPSDKKAAAQQRLRDLGVAAGLRSAARG